MKCASLSQPFVNGMLGNTGATASVCAHLSLTRSAKMNLCIGAKRQLVPFRLGVSLIGFAAKTPRCKAGAAKSSSKSYNWQSSILMHMHRRTAPQGCPPTLADEQWIQCRVEGSLGSGSMPTTCPWASWTGQGGCNVVVKRMRMPWCRTTTPGQRPTCWTLGTRNKSLKNSRRGPWMATLAGVSTAWA